jgi:hypothetical protein
LYDERDRVLKLQAECDELKGTRQALFSHAPVGDIPPPSTIACCIYST